MGKSGLDYIRGVWDSIVHGKSNKEKKLSAAEEIEEFLKEYAESKVPARPTLPDVPEYERMEYEAPDDETLRKFAENALAAYKAQGEKDIDNKIESQRTQFGQELESAQQSRLRAEERAAAEYATAKRNTDADMLRRGLARSSIAAGQKAALERGEAETRASLFAAYEKQAGEIARKIGELDAQRKSALEDFNLAYAVKLTDKIAALEKERDDKKNEALEYNNSLAQKEHAALVDKQMKESDLYSELLAQKEKENKLHGSVSDDDYAAVYTVIAEKLRTLSASDAREIVLKNPNVRESVGSGYYYKLYDEFCR